MKNKLNIKARMLSAAVVTAAFFVGMTPMTAYAGGPDCPIEEVQPDDPETVAAEEPETPEKSEEHYGPLTPDGNMDLVDDYGSVEAGGKQFITVTTKAGNYFYIIIDRDDEGNENVHFLNLVDEADLLSLMDDEEVDKYIAATKPEEEPVEPEVVEPTPTPEPEPEEPEPEKNNHLGLMAFLLLGTATAIGAFIYLKKTKDTKKPADDYDPDADYDESEENYLDSLPDDLDDDFEMISDEEEE